MTGARVGLVLLLLVLVVPSGCAPARRGEPAGHAWQRGGHPVSEIDGDLDRAAERWRREISEQRWREDAGALARAADLSAADAGAPPAFAPAATDPAPPRGFWGRIKAGVDAVGKASFAAVTVVVSLAVMAAPYLLL